MTALEPATDTLPAEIVEDLDEEGARLLTNRIRQCVAVAHESVVHAYRGRAWLALGYKAWDDYCEAEFGGARLPIPKADRSEVVALLRAEGLSTRAIASAIGISKNTVTSDLSQIGTPAAVIGADGKTYPAFQPDRDRVVEGAGDREAPPGADGTGDAAAGFATPSTPVDRGVGDAGDREASGLDEDGRDAPPVAEISNSPTPDPIVIDRNTGEILDDEPEPEPDLPQRTPEEQRLIDRQEAIQRRRNDLHAIHAKWETFAALRTNPDRAEILRGLTEGDRQFVLELERRITWKI